MHLLFLTRGHLDEVRKLISGLHEKFLPMEFTQTRTKKKGVVNVQTVVRPIQLWEIIFPEKSPTNEWIEEDPKYRDNLELMMNTLRITDKDSYVPKANKFAMMLRRAFGLKKLPKKVTEKEALMLRSKDVHVIPIGYKTDKILKDVKQGGLDHEGL